MVGIPRWKCEQLQRNVFQITLPITRNAKWEAWALAVSDLHIDSIHCDRELLTKHLQEAKRRNAFILMLGDVMDLLQGAGDKRASKAELRACFNVDNYWDKAVEEVAKYLAPYSHNIALISQGNHEFAVKQFHETDLLQRLIGHLNITTKSKIFYGEYGGWVRVRHQSDAARWSHNIKYHHGTGFNESNAVAKCAAYPDADIVLLGDKHQRWAKYPGRDRFPQHMKQHIDRQAILMIPGYKQEYGDGAKSWAVRKGFRPNVCGGWWIRFYWERSAERIEFEVIEAQ